MQPTFGFAGCRIYRVLHATNYVHHHSSFFSSTLVRQSKYYHIFSNWKVRKQTEIVKITQDSPGMEGTSLISPVNYAKGTPAARENVPLSQDNKPFNSTWIKIWMFVKICFPKFQDSDSKRLQRLDT